MKPTEYPKSMVISRLTNQLTQVMDTNNDGKISREEWEGFDWAHIVDQIKEGLDSETKEMGRHLAGKWRMHEGLTLTLLRDNTINEKWGGNITVKPDGTLVSDSLMKSDTSTILSFTPESKINENGWLEAKIKLPLVGNYIYKGPVDVGEDGTSWTVDGTFGPEILGDDMGRFSWSFSKI